MSFSRFLETYPLYRTFKLLSAFESRASIREEAPAIHTSCVVCRAERTFSYARGSRLLDGAKLDAAPGSGWVGPKPLGHQLCNVITFVNYTCNYCNKCERVYFVKFDEDGCGVMKVGQFPPWDISVPKNLSDRFPNHLETFKKGLISESQGFGIGAFGYYRRIVELTIDELLASVSDLLRGDEKDRYGDALEKAKQTIVAQDKIDLVKDLLPSSLRPAGMNPLSILHSTLSRGLHSLSDEECLASAEAVRVALVSLVNEIASQGDAQIQMTDAMRKLLDKKSRSRSDQ